jgi:hypothetical protein
MPKPLPLEVHEDRVKRNECVCPCRFEPSEQEILLLLLFVKNEEVHEEVKKEGGYVSSTFQVLKEKEIREEEKYVLNSATERGARGSITHEDADQNRPM